MKLYTESQVIRMMELARFSYADEDNILFSFTPFVLPTDEEIESKYNKFIDDEIQLGFLKQEQGERLKWYYKTYFINKIQGGNK